MAGLSRCLLALGVLFAPIAAPALACPFCTLTGKTLSDEVNQATMVIYGSSLKTDEVKDEAEFAIEAVIKDHKIRGKKTTITLPRHIPPTGPGGVKLKYLIFCDVFKGKVDPYHGLAVSSSAKVPAYLKGVLALKDKPAGERLRFFFDYLDNADSEISNDAYKEFGNASYEDFRAMAKKLPAERVIKWLKDPETPSFRLGLYASMLGHCGKEKDADVLRAILDDEEKRAGSGLSGVMAGYVMLKPKDGWKYVTGTLKDAKEDFSFRYAALGAVRFLRQYRGDVVRPNELADAVCLLLPQDDIADMAIEDLRKWKAWDRADQVLGVRKTEAYKVPIIRRAVLRYCLACKGSKAAAAYVAERRKEDAEAVQEAEELLKAETDDDDPPPPPKKTATR